MALYAMLSLDYAEKEPNRDDFYEYLKSNGWVKLNDVDTVWCKSHGYLSTDAERVEREIRAMMRAAVAEYKPYRIDFVAQIGNNLPFEAQFVKKGIEYEYTSK
ncbi:hypothetical protein [Pseudomonas sp. S32]|uniref:hypothetical protein n=1 Tax=Pseudomonas sp. S32 TaxID=2767448 RepID=UPI001913433C|nr:hypothetical protein [Pseudomonas sp. S32]MBK5003481.1 hypothetical protein [Pseudomonas sp. S32]